MVVYADERPFLETLLHRYDGGGLKIDEGYEGGQVYCRVWFSVFLDQGDGLKNYRLCTNGLHKRSFKVARHEAVCGAIKRLQGLFKEKIKMCCYSALRTAKTGEKRAIEIAVAAEKRQRVAESMAEEAMSAKEELDDHAKMVEAAYKEAENAGLAAEADAARDKENKEKVLSEFNTEHMDRIATEESLHIVEQKLDEMTKKRDEYLAHNLGLEHKNGDMEEQLAALESVIGDLEDKLSTAVAENERLRQRLAANDLFLPLP